MPVAHHQIDLPFILELLLFLLPLIMLLPPHDNFMHKTLNYLVDNYFIYALHLRFAHEA